MLYKLIEKFKKIKYVKKKSKIVFLGLLLLCVLGVAYNLINKTIAYYSSNFKLKTVIDRALYIFSVEGMSFNIEPSKIIPSATPYKYNFTISNFDKDKHSDLDLEYTITVKTTTNLPISIELFDEENPNSTILVGPEYKQDVDGAWYRVYKTTAMKQMKYQSNVTHTYTLSVYFPEQYKDTTNYADSIENIEITIKSQQVI